MFSLCSRAVASAAVGRATAGSTPARLRAAAASVLVPHGGGDGQATSHRRSLFSNAYLGGDKLADKRHEFLSSMPSSDISSTRARTLELTQSSSGGGGSGPVLLSDDVRTLLFTAESADDLRQAAAALKAFVARSAAARLQNASVQRMNRMLVRELLILCRAAADGGAEIADFVMKDAEFVSQLNLFGGLTSSANAADGAEEEEAGGGLTKLAPMITLTYSQILYDHERFEELFAFMERCAESGTPPVNMLSLAVAACYRSAAAGDAEAAFARATRYMSVVYEQTNIWYVGRAGCLYALMAMRRGDLTLAHEELAFVKEGFLRNNIQILLYSKLGRFTDAIRTIESSVQVPDRAAFRQRRPWYCQEVVQQLANDVENCDSADTKKRLAALFNRLDDHAEIRQATLEDLALAPIHPQRFDPNRQSQRSSFPQRNLGTRRPPSREGSRDQRLEA